MSSPELKVEPMLAFLQGKSVVTSVLLTVGLITCKRRLFGKRPNKSPGRGAQGFVLFGG